MGRVEALCVSVRKGDRKGPVAKATFRAEHGIVGDAHAGPGRRQVSLLAAEDIDALRRAKLPDLKPGDFAENVILSGLDLASLGVGSRLCLGRDVVLCITQIGKECHTPCRIYHLTGDCLMPRRGLFARVEAGGEVRVGDVATVTEQVVREPG